MKEPVKRAFRFRFYPTPEQAGQLSRTFGCVRLVYNWGLQSRSEAYTLRGEKISYADTDRMLTALKATEERAFLNEVSSVPLQQALRHLNTAYTNFFDRRAKYPRFKSRKKSKQSATYTRSAFSYRDGMLKLAKHAEALDIAWSRPLPRGVEPSTVTVTRDSADRWFVVLLCQDAAIGALPKAANPIVGVDAGTSALLTFSTGEKISNAKHEARERERLARAQRQLARKQKGSANRERARVKVARVHARIADRRRDDLHKLTTRLVRENQAIVIEDLSVSNMVGNHRLARAISDAAWSELRTQLGYKCAWYGRSLIVVDRWYPSTKTCSGCGHLKARLPLGERTYRCERCGLVLDRDVNAALNLEAAGLAVLACGADVRPRRSAPGGRLATKQETHGATRGIPAP